ncbi:MAG: DUF6352 family protein [Geminicoccaceae bacterium]
MSGAIWASAGRELLDPAAGGGLAVTASFLKAYLARPELAPVPESCAAERALHGRLLADPMAAVEDSALAALADPDVAQNWRVWLGFRDFLARRPSLEAAYLALVKGEGPAVPALFVDQLVHVILRHLLDGETDAYQWRAAECLFRPQKVSITEGGILLADEETVEQAAATDGFGGLGQLLAQAGTVPRSVELDVLGEGNAAGYAGRSERFDMVLDVAFTRPGSDALARVLERWVAHFLKLAIRLQPVQTIQDERWAWHVGLDVEATGILNAMWQGAEVPQADLARILGLFRLEIQDPSAMLERVAGRPVYLAMAMDREKRLRLKPQNLLLGLPLRQDMAS